MNVTSPDQNQLSNYAGCSDGMCRLNSNPSAQDTDIFNQVLNSSDNGYQNQALSGPDFLNAQDDLLVSKNSSNTCKEGLCSFKDHLANSSETEFANDFLVSENSSSTCKEGLCSLNKHASSPKNEFANDFLNQFPKDSPNLAMSFQKNQNAETIDISLQNSGNSLNQAAHDNPSTAKNTPNTTNTLAANELKANTLNPTDSHLKTGDKKATSDLKDPNKPITPNDFPSNQTLFKSLFGETQSPKTTNVAGPSLNEINGLVEKMVNRILVAEPASGGQEIRLQLGEGSLNGSELSLTRTQDGKLLVNISCKDASAFQTAVQGQHNLISALESKGENIKVTINMQDAAPSSNQENNSQKRSRGLDYLVDKA